jgi:hypothetical protein
VSPSLSAPILGLVLEAAAAADASILGLLLEAAAAADASILGLRRSTSILGLQLRLFEAADALSIFGLLELRLSATLFEAANAAILGLQLRLFEAADASILGLWLKESLLGLQLRLFEDADEAPAPVGRHRDLVSAHRGFVFFFFEVRLFFEAVLMPQLLGCRGGVATALALVATSARAVAAVATSARAVAAVATSVR